MGAAEAAGKRPDGHTLLQININHTSGEALYKNLSYSLVDGFGPVIRFAQSYYVFVVNPKIEAKTIAELVEEAKAKPRQIEPGDRWRRFGDLHGRRIVQGCR